MKSLKSVSFFFFCLFLSTITWAAKDPSAHLPGKLDTRLTPTELTREAVDSRRYPVFMKFLQNFDWSKGVVAIDPRNEEIVPSTHHYKPTQEDWMNFFQAAAADRLTNIRAFTLLARELKKRGVVVYGPGREFQAAADALQVDMGLAIPARNIGTAVWYPDPSISDPEFLLHLRVYYTESYVHRFPDNILPANLKIGYGNEGSYWLDGEKFTQKTISADLYYGPTKGVGFRNVKGVGGQKRGVLGFFQKMLFFLPDAISSMTIDEKNDTLITEALINTKVKKFESTPKYAITIGKQKTPASGT